MLTFSFSFLSLFFLAFESPLTSLCGFSLNSPKKLIGLTLNNNNMYGILDNSRVRDIVDVFYSKILHSFFFFFVEIELVIDSSQVACFEDKRVKK